MECVRKKNRPVPDDRVSILLRFSLSLSSCSCGNEKSLKGTSCCWCCCASELKMKSYNLGVCHSLISNQTGITTCLNHKHSHALSHSHVPIRITITSLPHVPRSVMTNLSNTCQWWWECHYRVVASSYTSSRAGLSWPGWRDQHRAGVLNLLYP